MTDLSKYVKPLEWRDSYGVMRAETPFGDYKIVGKVLHLPGTNRAEMVGNDLYKAAQADYARRILSAHDLDALIAAGVKAGLEMAATTTFNSDKEAPEPDPPFYSWGDMVADTSERHARMVVDHKMWSLAQSIRATSPEAIASVVARVKGEAG